jgi:hypothetical protein
MIASIPRILYFYIDVIFVSGGPSEHGNEPSVSITSGEIEVSDCSQFRTVHRCEKEVVRKKVPKPYILTFRPVISTNALLTHVETTEVLIYKRKGRFVLDTLCSRC